MSTACRALGYYIRDIKTQYYVQISSLQAVAFPRLSQLGPRENVTRYQYTQRDCKLHEKRNTKSGLQYLPFIDPHRPHSSANSNKYHSNTKNPKPRSKPKLSPTPQNPPLQDLRTQQHPFFYIGIYAAISLSTVLVNITGIITQYTGALRASRVLFARLLNTVVHATMRWYDVTPTGKLLWDPARLT